MFQILTVSLIIECPRIQQGYKSSDLISLIICGSLLCAHFSVAILHSLPFMMEDLDSHHFIVGVEVSCWQDQLRKAVSNYLISSSKLFFLKYFFFLGIFDITYQFNISFRFLSNFIQLNFYQAQLSFYRVLQRLSWPPLQASSILIKADRHQCHA